MTTAAPSRPDRRGPDDRGSVPPPDLRPRPDGRVVEAAAGHGPGRRRLLLGRRRQALSRRDLGHLRRLGRPQQPPGDRGDPPAARRRWHFSPPMHGTNPLAVQLANLLAELAPGDLSTVKFQCGGSEVTEAAIKLARQYHRLTGLAGQVQDHQPLPVVARLDAGLALGLGARSRARRSTSRWPRASCTSSRRPATAARSARPTPTAASPARRSSST